MNLNLFDDNAKIPKWNNIFNFQSFTKSVLTLDELYIYCNFEYLLCISVLSILNLIDIILNEIDIIVNEKYIYFLQLS